MSEISKVDIHCLDAFLTGVWAAENIHKIKDRIIDFDKFELWLRKKLKEKACNVKSFWFAERYSGGDLERAYHLWFEWYDEFTKKKN